MTDEWILDKNEIEIMYDQVLGKGEFGIVYKAKWRGMIVAAKQFKDLDVHKIKLMQNEFEAMTKLHHPNIIQLLGYINDPFTIIMEYLSKGSLSSYILKKTSLKTKIKFMIDIALGLTYLHQRKPSYIIHRDIKPSNFLITNDLHVKIVDFGLCKILRSSQSFIKKSQEKITSLENISGTANVGTLYYMAPELIHYTNENILYNSNVDIYSFGSVMYEIFEKCKIFNHVSSRKKFLELIFTNETPTFNKSPFFIKNLIIQCLDHDPSKRPNAISVLNELDSILKKYWWLKYYYY